MSMSVQPVSLDLISKATDTAGVKLPMLQIWQIFPKTAAFDCCTEFGAG